MDNPWREEFRLNLKEIDGQHKKFFDLHSDLLHFIESAGASDFDQFKLIRMIFKFRTYALYHFYTEESLMLTSRYPGYFVHVAAHNNYIEQMIKAEKKFITIYHEIGTGKAEPLKLLDAAREINHFVTSWYSRHIMKVDREYAAFLKGEKG